MKWLQTVLAWSNLGYWDDARSSYPQACQTLATHLANRLQLESNDRVLDLGCGQGASLLLWQQHYQVQQLCAVELQAECVQRIQHTLNSKIHIIQTSFLNLNSKLFSAPFNVVFCLDAAYHSDLNSFLRSTHSVLNSKGHLQLEANLKHSIEAQGYQQVAIEDLSDAVLAGFSRYYHVHLAQQVAQSLDHFKIKMTAKLCQKLFEQGIVRYVQITAMKDNLK